MYDPRLRAPTLLDRLAEDVWPDPTRLSREGLGAIGGALTTRRILSAYAHGYFPCYGEETPRLWWCPDPRAVFLPGAFHASARLARRLRQARFDVTWNQSFHDVVVECGEQREDGRWILEEIVDAYDLLNAEGRAFSLEVRRSGRLVGGVYGVHCGGVFAAESMFHRETDASKVALAVLLPSLFAAGIEMVDVQYPTPHLSSLGVTTLPRGSYLKRLETLAKKSVDLRSLVLKTPR